MHSNAKTAGGLKLIYFEFLWNCFVQAPVDFILTISQCYCTVIIFVSACHVFAIMLSTDVQKCVIEKKAHIGLHFTAVSSWNKQ